MKIKIGNKFCFIDGEDKEKILKINWHINPVRRSFYVRASPRYGRCYLHRFLMMAPQNRVVDHINGNTLDNRKLNLRVCRQGENSLNARKKRSHKRYKGIYKTNRRQKQKWWAQIYANGISHFLGYHRTACEAAKAYDSAALLLHGEFSKLNFPEGDADESR